MATIPTDLLHGDANSEDGILSTLLAKAHRLFCAKTEQGLTLAERVNQADAKFYDRFYG